ncbi:uncharacterized protein LOC135129861 [Zophobas morio]|uniref:uncharacterized protein LOC135129861 n=1 Tax=Zophobas morio TaxID=2755281 RepID=UPI0030838AB0
MGLVGARGESIIDYGNINEEAWEGIESFKLGERVESDNMPLEIKIKGKEEEYRSRLEKKKFEVKEDIEAMLAELINLIIEATEKRMYICIYGKGGIMNRTENVWREGIIIPLFKNGQKSDVENHRGITLLNMAYKTYAMILDERLRKEMEARGMFPDGQAGSRKGRSTMDNVYILRHLVGREIRKEGGRIVNREKMWEYLSRKGVYAYLVTKMEEIYEETVSKVRVNGIESETYLGDIDELFREAQTGGVVVGKEKVWSLAYADDLVIVAKKREEMKTMIKSFEKHVQEMNWK